MPPICALQWAAPRLASLFRRSFISIITAREAVVPWTSQMARALIGSGGSLIKKGAQEIMRDGIHKVFAVRWDVNDDAEAVFCYGSGHFVTMKPRHARYGGTHCVPYFPVPESNWRTDRLLSAAPVATQAWLPLRQNLQW